MEKATFLTRAAQAAQAGNLPQARLWLEQAVAQTSAQPELYWHLAGLCADLQDISGQQQALDQLLTLEPTHARALFQRAQLYLRFQQPEPAARCLAAAIQTQPDFYAAWLQAGNVQRQLGQLGAALQSYTRCTQLRPQAAEAWYNLGLVQEAQTHYAAATESFRQALALRPDTPDILYHLANCYHELFQIQACLALYRRLVELVPDRAKWWCHLGNAFTLLQQWAAADEAFTRARELAPDFLEAQVAQVYFHLLHGDLKAANAREFEYRRKRRDLIPQVDFLSAIPEWQGNFEPEKQLVVVSELGLGDNIQYARYFPLLSQQGLSVSLWSVHPALVRLFKSLSITGLEIQPTERPPQGDMHVLLWELPYFFKTELSSVPAAIPYFSLSPRSLPAGLALPGIRNIGLVWASGRKLSARFLVRSYRQRSAGLSAFVPLIEQAGARARFFSFQVGPDARELEDYPTLPVADLSPNLGDLYDTGCLLQQMDLVISVDTAVAHLAGALGIPVWIVLPHMPDARWGLTGSQSHWYPSARLFRQPDFNDWAGVFQAVGDAFAQWLTQV